MDKKSLEVVEHVTAYFKEYLPKDTVLGVGRKSDHPDEAHFYTVLSKRENNGWGFCDCWDEKKKILIRGCYGIEFLDSFVRILNKDQEKPTNYAVYSCDDKAKNLLFITEDESKARKFCESYEWEWEDDYGNAYRLFYEVTL